ncbi:hypothetical protein Pmar_PMAR021431 [Perkinsus marinus ATCC 50983]|uniref:Uncharacterized protein n=1 Tax=Perkinsus marinus (strain ATCC 50983 / TXsc) TaxID=423536 RepID=C5KX96_PERM5|nr:hypothetical protein Pmar_PMAR021431 [Perkinsus marinus ATCC 50983]EER10952.1 hypothetical protein Pmar_PMAR021431 [Perkinsus marinus ATCC 50983]|eukprot:XP_002779157.1 hypothetical protein Pmar_PMAR021431 [Perkinsus marinus ATCC 50983]
MADTLARETEAFRAIFPASCPTVLRDALIDRLLALGVGTVDLSTLVSKPDMLKNTIVDVLCPIGEKETADQRQLRLIRGLRIESALQGAAKAFSNKHGPAAQGQLEYMERISKRYGGAASPGLVVDQATVKLLSESPATYREVKLGSDRSTGGKKPVVDVNGNIQWIPDSATGGRKPRNLSELWLGLLPILLCIDTSCNVNGGPWVLHYLQELCRVSMLYAESAAMVYDTQFRRSLNGRAFALAERERIPLSQATVRLLGGAMDQEALSMAMGPRSLVEDSQVKSNSSHVVSGSGPATTPNKERASKAPPPGICPHTRNQCPLLKLRKCPWPPKSHKKDTMVGKELPPTKKQRP